MMTRKERCELAIEKGFTYNPKTGEILFKNEKKFIYNHSGYSILYLYLGNNKFQLRGHHFAWYYMYKECVEEIDHINGIRDDNRIINLRSVTRQQNQWNRKTAKGYYLDKKTNKFNSQIYLNRKRIRLGYFDTEEEARNAYVNAKEKYHII
jgi:hypothetical protein